MDVLQWDGLTFLGSGLVQQLRSAYQHPFYLANSLDSENDAREALRQLMNTFDADELLDEGARRLYEWSLENKGVVKRCRRDLVSRAQYTLATLNTTVQVSASEAFEQIVQSEPKYALEVAKKAVKARKADRSGGSRAETEAAERRRFALELSVLIKEACLPVVYQIEQLDNQNIAWERIFGSRRSKTLRNRFRSWNKFRMWLIASAGVVWPRDIRDLVNYVEELLQVGAPMSLHGELQAALVLMEQVGRVPESRQLSRDGTWKSHLSAWDVEQEKGCRPRGAAPPFTVAILIALELTVCNIDIEFYRRAVAWIMLVATWASMRTDDIQRVAPESLRLSNRGFSMKMARTKTTGPGKLHGQIFAFVRRDVSLTGRDWLFDGLELFKHESANYPRDYLVPSPSENWTAFRKKLLEPPQLANYFRMVLQGLGTPKFEDGEWRVNQSMELVPLNLSLYWSGHSPRHVMSQASASIGCAKDDRDFLGRWCIGKVGSNAYLLTSRQIVERLQHEVFESFFHRGKQYDEGELLEDVKDFADKHDMIGHRIRRRHKVVPLKSALQSGVVSMMDPDTENEEIDDVEVEKGKVLAFVQDADKQDDGDVITSGVQGKYFITVSRRTGFRRLHVVGSCHVKAERCQQVVDLDSLEGQNFDAICKFCKRGLKQLTGDEVEESSSSSTGDSTSTCTDTDVELGGS